MTTEPVKAYQAHRFRDLLALTIDGFPTIYLKPSLVKLLSRDLEDFDREYSNGVSFFNSTFGNRGGVASK